MLARRSRSVVGLVLALSLLSACNGRDAVVTSLVAVQGAAIAANASVDANGQPLLSTQDTGKIVTFTTQALATITAAKSGWQDAVKTGWASFQTDIPAKAKAQFSTQLAVLSAAIAAL